MKKPHHSGTYHQDSRKLVALARANDPYTVCWRDGLPLDHHPAHHNGKPPTWTAGHTIDGNSAATPWTNVTQQPPPGNWLAPEASTCNYSHGNNQPNPHSRNW